MDDPVVVVGAGIAGLNCARILTQSGIDVIVLEADDAIGGRIQTDAINGFLLDRGFQVLLTEYPEARSTLDYERLELKPFSPGALVWIDGRFHRISDPFRDPKGLLATIGAPIGSLRDKLGIMKLRTDVSTGDGGSIFDRPETTVLDALQKRGFSSRIIERFFRPFFGGIMLDPTLLGSSRMFEYVFRMFSRGAAALPALGMQQIPMQIAAPLKPGSVHVQSRVASVEKGLVVLDDGRRFKARAVVVAVDGPSANTLLGLTDSPRYLGTRNIYFTAKRLAFSEPTLVINGEGIGPINNVAVLSSVAPSYTETAAPLISVTVLDESLAGEELEVAVRKQLAGWFGDGVAGLTHLRTYEITHALPDQRPPFLSPPQKSVRLETGVYRAGDYIDTASINGALSAGRRAAGAVMADLKLA